MLHGFELLERRKIKEINAIGEYYLHKKSGAELLSIQNDDENKVFGINFHTPYHSSNGVAHIMEHSVLCGSRKYPVKEPYIELKKGSLNTFVNAFTGSDFTSYPVASQNLQDFYNLVDVYLDAVLYPLLPPHILEQEGWHYELEAVGSKISIKGVVYNEMKGAYSSPNNLVFRYSQSSLFPDNVYRFDSGGDPEAIPDLTYNEFKKFHEVYYHPSNARIYFYGDDDPEERLRFLNTYLEDFEAIELASEVELQRPFDRPVSFVYPYDAGEEDENKAIVTSNWLLPEVLDVEKHLAFSILDYILLATPASPLRKALIDSGLGEDIAGGGLADHIRQMYYSVGMKGISPENAEKVHNLIQQTLAELVENGIDRGMLAASLNTIEFQLRENNTGRFPRGISLMLRALRNWNYGGNPIDPLEYDDPLRNISKKLEEDARFFEKIIEENFLENLHRTTVLLKPDKKHRSRSLTAEQARIDEAASKLTTADLENLVNNTRNLIKIQETPDPPEALATIPTLTLDDLDKKIRLVPTENLKQDKVEILYHDLFTNGILYFDIGFDLHSIPQKLLPLLPLFSQGLLEMGTEDENFVKLTQRIGSKTGGISPVTFVSGLLNQSGSAAKLFLRSKGTMAQVDDMFVILRDILLKVNFDNKERFHQLVLEAKAGKEASLVSRGHIVANTRLRAHFTENNWLSELMGGVENLFFLRDLVSDIENDWEKVLKNLETIRNLLVNRNAAVCNVTVDSYNWEKVRPRMVDFLNSLPEFELEKANWSPGDYPNNEGLTIPAQVNYVGKGSNLYEAGYQFNGSIQVISKYLDTTWLWEKVRIQGGAYGVFSMFDWLTGVLTFQSYRDPNVLGTLENYDSSVEFLRSLDLSNEELVKIIIGTIGDIDAYQLPDAKGYSALLRYLVGVNDTHRQQLRDEVLATTRKDFNTFAEFLHESLRKAEIVLLGSAEDINKANLSKDQPWLSVKRVL